MKTLKEYNTYFDEKYNNKKFKIWNSKYFTSFWIYKTKDLLDEFKKEFRIWIDKEYYASLYIHWRYFDLDKIHIEDDNLENLFNKSIDRIEKHFTK